MKITIKICLLAFFTAVLFTACNNENIDTIVEDEPPVFTPAEIELNNLVLNLSAGDEASLSLRCVKVNLPFDLIKEDDTKVTVFTYDEYKMAVEAEAPNRITDFSYPLTGIDQNGESAEFETLAELGSSFASCVPDKGWISSTRSNATIPAFLLDGWCFSIVYPVDLEDEEGNSYTAETEEEFIDLCATIDPLFFSLPLTVSDQNGDEVIFETADAFLKPWSNARELIHPLQETELRSLVLDVLSLQYPFDVALDDGSIETVNDEDEYVALLMSGTNLEIQFPFNLTNADGETLVINTIEDLIDALIECGLIIDIGEPAELCDTEAHVLLFFNGFNILTINNYPYEVNLPVTLIVEGEEVVINSVDDYFAATGAPFDIVPTEISYPVTVTQFGQEIVLENDNDVCALINSLVEPCENKPAHIQFFFRQVPAPVNCAYFAQFPIDITFNSNTITLEDLDQYYELLNGDPDAYEGIELTYPVSAVNASSGEVLFFENGEEICAYLDNCE